MTDRPDDTPATDDDEARASHARIGAARRGSAPGTRDARLKAALKANIARRKARSQMLGGAPLQDPDDPIPPEADSNEPDSPQPDFRKD